ncbi:MAG TPA: heme o synthase [Candidatus Saccharimonadales bacterium]|jgi:protoheme IX farnesyltransferase
MTFSHKEIKSYYALAKPGIIYGNLPTAIAGYLFASHWHNNYGVLIAMILGLALIIGCGCVVNNVIDKDIDSKMERTKKRAVVTGEINTKSALKYALVLGVLGVLVLGIFTNALTLGVALFGLIVYVAVYGLAKRKTVYSTLVGALAGAVPPLVGYVAFTDTVDQGGVIIVFILICWQMTHFYGISLYRKKEYMAAKLPLWSIVKGDWSAQLQAMGFIAVFAVLNVSLFVLGYVGFIYLVVMMVVSLGWLWYCVVNVGKLSPSAWGRQVFLKSLMVILIFSVMLALGPVLP